MGLPPNLSIRLFNTVRIRLMLRFFGGQASRPILPCFAAEGVGLEPTRANRPAGFQDQFLSHSEHPSTFLWRRRRDFRQTADKLLIPPPCLAEEEGFEPSWAVRLAGLANLCYGPLSDSSKRLSNYIKITIFNRTLANGKPTGIKWF